MNHPIEQEDLMAYLDGELWPSRAAITAAHLEQCRECQAVAADLQGVGRQLKAWAVEPSGPRVAQDIGMAVREAIRQPPVRRLGPTTTLGRALTAGFAIVVLALIISTSFYQMTARGRAPFAAQISALQAPPAPHALIVHMAQLVLVTREFDKARQSIDDILKRHNGYLGQLNTSAPVGNSRAMDATLRVPDDQRDVVLAELKKLGRVESESQTGEDVTQQYTDLEARLINARNTEQRLTDILRQKTGKLSDVLAVELEIDKVRGEIERMEAEKKALTNRVTYAAINLRISEAYTVKSDSTLSRFRIAAAEGYRTVTESIVSVILFLLSNGPVLLFWFAVLFFPVRYFWKRRRGA